MALRGTSPECRFFGFNRPSQSSSIAFRAVGLALVTGACCLAYGLLVLVGVDLDAVLFLAHILTFSDLLDCVLLIV